VTHLHLAGPAYIFDLREVVPEGIVCSICGGVKRAVVSDRHTFTCIKCWIEALETPQTIPQPPQY